MGKKIAAAIPDSDLDLHIGGCWCLYEGVAVYISSTNSDDREVHIVNKCEGINTWVPVDEVEFTWPELGYVNTDVGVLYCERRASNGRHYRRAFSPSLFNLFHVVCNGVVHADRSNPEALVRMLYDAQYPTLEQGLALLVNDVRPAVALSKDTALAMGADGTILFHFKGRCVGSLDYEGRSVHLSAEIDPELRGYIKCPA